MRFFRELDWGNRIAIGMGRLRRRGRRLAVGRELTPKRVASKAFSVVVAVFKVVLPMTEVCAGLLEPNRHPVDVEVAPYCRDWYDHSLRLTERVDGLRGAIEVISSTGPAVQRNSLNEVRKKLTAWVAIIVMPTEWPDTPVGTFRLPGTAAPSASC